MLPKEKLLKLKNHLSNALNKKISHTDCAELIFISKSIIIPYLSNSKASFLRLSEIHGLDINDLAIDVIADVFRQDTDGNFVNIKNFTSKLYYSLEETNEENLFRAYQSYLRVIADSQVGRLYAELDPNGFKIMRNIKESLPFENLALRKTILGTMIFISGSEDYDKLPYLTFENFERDFILIATGNLSTKDLLRIILAILVEQENFRKEINLIDAVNLFKKYYKVDQSLLREDGLFENIVVNSFVDQLEIDHIYSSVLQKIREKIFIDYFSKGKLTLEQTKAVDGAITDIAYDLLNMGKNHTSFYDYLYKHLSIDREEYEIKFKSKLEYLVKRIRIEFGNYFYTKE